MRPTKNRRWPLAVDRNGVYDEQQAQIAVLMDIRDELQELKKTASRISRAEVLDLLYWLKTIGRNTGKRAKRKKKKI